MTCGDHFETGLAVKDLDVVLASAISRLQRRLRSEKAVDQIGETQRLVLARLVREGPHTLGELSDRERVKPPSMNQTINSLVELGYVERQDDPTDGRKVILVATSTGRLLIEESRRRFYEWLQGALSTLNEDERVLLGDAAILIGRIADS
jgi:DNA-binding MarR family transcriptional regulator